jgi:pilus assembly protein FimV
MNRLRAGNVIRIPVENELQTISSSEATNEIRIQMADWRAYRANLAAMASETEGVIDEVDRKESGRVESSADRVNIQDGAQNSHVVKISKGDGSERGALEGLQERLLATEKALEEQKRLMTLRK